MEGPGGHPATTRESKVCVVLKLVSFASVNLFVDAVIGSLVTGRILVETAAPKFVNFKHSYSFVNQFHQQFDVFYAHARLSTLTVTSFDM